MTISDAPLYKFVVWLLGWHQLGVCALVAAIIGSALGVVYASFETRQAYAEIQQLERDQDFLDSEYEKLLLEQSAWADYSRVDQISREELGMSSPDADAIVVVTR